MKDKTFPGCTQGTHCCVCKKEYARGESRYFPVSGAKQSVCDACYSKIRKHETHDDTLTPR